MNYRAKSKYLCIASMILVVGIIVSPVIVSAGTMQVPKGLELKVRFVTDAKLSSDKIAKDSIIPIVLIEPIIIGGKTIVEADAKGTAKVVEVRKAGVDDKPGYIKIAFIDLEPKGSFTSPTRSKIKLSGGSESEGKKKKILLLFVKKTQGEITTKNTYKATVAESIVLESK